MPRAEHSHDVGDIFRRKVEEILKPLRYDVLASKHTISCKCTDVHNTTEHTIDILARHVHAAESLHKKTIIIEAKKTMPSKGKIESMVFDLANKIDCLFRNLSYSEINEAMVLTQSNVSLRSREEFKKASLKIASSRDMFISLVDGSKFRALDGMSRIVKNSSKNSSVTIIPAGKNPDQDLGSPCPLNIDLISKHYVCALNATGFTTSIFKTGRENYNSSEFFEDMEWIKKYRGVLYQIHSCQGFTDDVPNNVKSTKLPIGLIDHNLNRTFFTEYLDYHQEDS